MNKFFTLFLIFLFSGLVFAQTSKKSELKRIDSYCKTVDIFIKSHKRPQLIFADISPTAKEKWRQFSSEKALEKFRENTETYSIAYNWKRRYKIIQSNFTLFSESGDWAKYIYHYFRADGTLAKVESTLNTFYGHFTFLQNIYFNKKGKILKTTAKYLDLKTQKPIHPRREDIFDNGDNTKAVYYKTTDKLPFAYLLIKK